MVPKLQRLPILDLKVGERKISPRFFRQKFFRGRKRFVRAKMLVSPGLGGPDRSFWPDIRKDGLFGVIFCFRKKVHGFPIRTPIRHMCAYHSYTEKDWSLGVRFRCARRGAFFVEARGEALASSAANGRNWFLQESVVSLRKSAVFCENLQLPNLLINFQRESEAKISKTRETSAKICQNCSKCHF